MNSKEESSIYLEGLELIDERIKWSKHRIKFLKRCLEEEQEELAKHKKEREKIVQRLKEYGIKLEDENEQRRQTIHRTMQTHT